MKQSEGLGEIIAVIMNEVEQHPNKPHMEASLRSYLVRKGFKPEDVVFALYMLRNHIEESSTCTLTDPGAIRQFIPYEANKIRNPEVRSALARLELYKLISSLERELIIERLVQFDGEITFFELEFVVTWVIAGTRNVDAANTTFSVLHRDADALN